MSEGMQIAGRGVKTVAVVWGIIAMWKGSVKYSVMYKTNML